MELSRAAAPDPELSSRIDQDIHRQRHAERRRCFLRGFYYGRMRIDRRRLWGWEPDPAAAEGDGPAAA
jgi:hypothetical protein